MPPALLETAGPGRVRATLDLRPHEDDWWIASDLEHHRPPAADHVIGLGAASTTLLAATVRREITTALDVGTGSGVQALHLLRHAERVTATDALPRAIAMARLSFALSGLLPDAVELLCGDLLEPVAGREFDLIVSNPPFVLSPIGRRRADLSRRRRRRQSGTPAPRRGRRARTGRSRANADVMGGRDRAPTGSRARPR